VIPPEANGEFVAAMEDVLEVYTRPVDPRRPVVCLDERPVQLVGETRSPIAAQPGQPERVDYEYVRHGTANLFLCCTPLTGWRQVTVTAQRCRTDWARIVKDLVDRQFPAAERIVLVEDNLNTHTAGSLYEAFPPAEARRLVERIEFHYTPTHGSWLNMAEIELSVLSRQCLGQRIPDIDTLRSETAAWEERRNTRAGPIDWRFTTDNAHINLKRLYPSVQQ
jgi:hypothetical protein